MKTATDVTNNTTVSVPVDPYKIDVSQGTTNGAVSRQWAARPSDQKFDTLGEMYDHLKRLHDRSFTAQVRTTDFVVAGGDLDFDETGMTQAEVNALARQRMNEVSIETVERIGGDVTRYHTIAPTHHAFGQICNLAKAPPSFMRELPSSQVADVLNYRLRYTRAAEEVQGFGTAFGSAEGDGGGQLLAATGPRYGRVYDHSIVAALMGIAGNGKGDDGFHWKAPGKIDWSNGTYDPENIGPREDRTFYASDRDMFAFLVDDRRPIVLPTKTRDGHPDHLFRGFFIQNSMMGTRSLKIATFYLRGVCMNRMLWGVEKFKEVTIRHTALAPERFLQEVTPALESYARSSDTALIEGVQRAQAKQLVADDAEALAFLRGKGRSTLKFSEGQAAAIVKKVETEEGRKPRTVWDFTQGITALARDALNTDDRLEIEMQAASLLNTVK